MAALYTYAKHPQHEHAHQSAYALHATIRNAISRENRRRADNAKKRYHIQQRSSPNPNIVHPGTNSLYTCLFDFARSMPGRELVISP